MLTWIDDLQFYKHVGMRVQLHPIGKIGRWRLRRNLDVTYPLRHDWFSEIRRVLMNNPIANLTTISGKCILMKPHHLFKSCRRKISNMNLCLGFKRNHTLTEHQARLNFALEYRRALGSGSTCIKLSSTRFYIVHRSLLFFLSPCSALL